jgi:hypothetical protein
MAGHRPPAAVADRLGHRAAEGVVGTKLNAFPGRNAARSGALLIRGPRTTTDVVDPGSAEQREGRCFASPGERCTASGTRVGIRRVGKAQCAHQ